MSPRNLSAWSANGKPSWSDFGFAVLALVWAVLQFATAETVSWGWIAIGFVVWAIGLGPVAASATGKRIGAWFEAIGMAGRAVAILAFFLVIFSVAMVVSIPTASVTSFVIGGFVAMFVVVVAEAVRTYTRTG